MISSSVCFVSEVTIRAAQEDFEQFVGSIKSHELRLEVHVQLRVGPD